LRLPQAQRKLLKLNSELASMDVRRFFSEDEKRRIVEAIRTAEADTSGEIRVHLTADCPTGALEAAALWFGKLKMHRTKARNGVLFLLAVHSREFAVIGDAGINAVVEAGFWDSIRDVVCTKFHDGLFADGLAEGILLTGRQLKEHFPRQADDVNELPDELSFS